MVLVQEGHWREERGLFLMSSPPTALHVSALRVGELEKQAAGELGSVWVGAWKGGLAVGRVLGQPHRRPLESWSTDWAALVSSVAGTQCPTRNMGVAHRLLTRLSIQLWIHTSTLEVLLLTFTMSWECWERFTAIYCDQFEMVPALRLSCLWERDSPPWERVGSRQDGAPIGGELSTHFLSSYIGPGDFFVPKTEVKMNSRVNVWAIPLKY